MPNAMMRDYYAQRASAGLILSEATSVTPMGVGYPRTPGIWSQEQVAGWKAVTEAVHRAGGRMVLQLWHVGRISDPIYLNGALPVAPSAIAAKGHVSQIRPQKPFVTPRALAIEEIAGVVEAFRKGAENAKAAGFDGVEIHGANGYLLDQFLQDGSNRRTDAYGGSIENRARLMLEVTDAAIGVFGAGRVGMHLAPRRDFERHGRQRSGGDLRLCGARAQEAAHRLHLRAGIARRAPARPLHQARVRRPLHRERRASRRRRARARSPSGEADAVAYGKLFIANPDLPRRFRLGAPLNAWNTETFYGPGPEGYVDYLELAEAAE